MIMATYQVTGTVRISDVDTVEEAQNAFDQLVSLAVNYGHVGPGSIQYVSAERVNVAPITLTLTDTEQRIVEETLRRFRQQ